MSGVTVPCQCYQLLCLQLSKYAQFKEPMHVTNGYLTVTQMSSALVVVLASGNALTFLYYLHNKLMKSKHGTSTIICTHNIIKSES